MVGSVRRKENEAIEIRFHSRGGQGGVTAAKLLAIAAFMDGKYSTASSFYGAERRGSPTVSFTRISSREIAKYSQIREPDCVVVMDKSIMETVDITKGIKEGGKILINTNNSREMLDLDKKVDVYTVDATGISIDLGLEVAGTPVLNIPILGAIAKLGFVELESIKKAIKEKFPEDKNLKAAEYAYRSVKKCRNG